MWYSDSQFTWDDCTTGLVFLTYSTQKFVSKNIYIGAWIPNIQIHNLFQIRTFWCSDLGQLAIRMFRTIATAVSHISYSPNHLKTEPWAIRGPQIVKCCEVGTKTLHRAVKGRCYYRMAPKMPFSCASWRYYNVLNRCCRGGRWQTVNIYFKMTL